MFLILRESWAGLLTGFVVAVTIVAFNSLIFKDNIISYFPLGVGSTLLGYIIVNFFTAGFSSFSYATARPEVAIAVIIAIIFANIAANPMPHENLTATLIATIMLLTLTVGLCMLLLGIFKLGQSVRFLPYPVLGGILLGCAMMMVRAAFYLLNNQQAFKLENLMQQHHLLQFGVSIFLTIIMLFSAQKKTRAWILPFSLITMTIIVLLSLKFNHISHQEAIRLGWILPHFSSPKFVVEELNFSLLQHIEWQIIAQQSSYILSVIGLIIIILLLNVSGLEVSGKQPADFERELKLAGIANLLGGIFGGLTAILSLSNTLLHKNLGGKYRTSGLLAGIVCFSILVFNTEALASLPIPVIASLLLFTGSKIIVGWLYEGWFTFPRMDYFIILFITTIITFWSFLPGILFGIVITSLNFIVQYAKINAIKLSVSGKYFHSNLIRPIQKQEWLSHHGDEILVIKLQGYLFFGSTKLLLDNLIKLLDEKEGVTHFLIFDFQFVNGIDTSTNFTFKRLHQHPKIAALTILFTGCNAEITQMLDLHGIFKNKKISAFPDLDQGLEWCESQLLKALPAKLQQASIDNTLALMISDKEARTIFLTFLEKLQCNPGDYLFYQNAPSDSLYFIDQGEVSVLLTQDEKVIRLSKSGPGTIVGELGFYLNIKRTASVRADTECSYYRLRQTDMKRLEEMHPHIVSIFYKNLIYLLASRLVQTTSILRAGGL